MSGLNHTRTIRKMLGMTQTAFGAAIGCTQGNIGHYETNAQTVPPKVAKKMILLARSKGFAINYEDIYGPADAT